MPPKAAAEGNDNSQIVIALCNMMINCSEFKIDSHALAPILNVSAKNVGRKINTLINPFGFEYKTSKIIRKDSDDAPATPTKATNDSTPASAPAKVAATKTPVSRKKTAAADATETKPKIVKTRVTKKRKLESVAPDDEEAVNNDSDGSTPSTVKFEKVANVKVKADVKPEPKDVIDSEDHPMSHVADDFEGNTASAEGEGASIEDEIKSEDITGSEED